MFSVITLATTLLAGAASAVPVARGVSAPFNVTVKSVDGTGPYQNNFVAACHTGAAEEAFCVLPANVSQEFTFRHVLTSDQSPGFLQFELNSTPPMTQDLNLVKQSNTSNVAFGFFGLGSNTEGNPVELQFAQDGQLGVVVSSSETQFEWVVCPQTTLGETFNTVGFVKDFATPTEANCDKVFLFTTPSQ